MGRTPAYERELVQRFLKSTFKIHFQISFISFSHHFLCDAAFSLQMTKIGKVAAEKRPLRRREDFGLDCYQPGGTRKPGRREVARAFLSAR
ncbi:hypothetical protein thsrh120_32730 [Rhizobium sp. No.120]